jgi:hypothetical protein
MPKAIIRRVSLLVLLVCSLLLASFGQQRKQAELTLRNLTRQSGYIFAGRVTSIEYAAPQTPNQVATMRLTFHVEQAFRGTRAGTSFTVQEWVGLWNAGEGYRVGERVLLFLHPRSKLGLTSPVGGLQGRFRLDKDGRVLIGLERAALLEPDQTLRRHKGRVPLRDFRRAVRKAQLNEE